MNGFSSGSLEEITMISWKNGEHFLKSRQFLKSGCSHLYICSPPGTLNNHDLYLSGERIGKEKKEEESIGFWGRVMTLHRGMRDPSEKFSQKVAFCHCNIIQSLYICWVKAIISTDLVKST